MSEPKNENQDLLDYLGAKSDEKLNPALLSYLEKAIERMKSADVSATGFPPDIAFQWRAILVESWLVANQFTGRQPLHPKDYDEEAELRLAEEKWRRFSAAIPFPGPADARRDDRPEWMKRSWA